MLNAKDHRVAVVATLDTKREEAILVADVLAGLGSSPLIIDVGLRDGDCGELNEVPYDLINARNSSSRIWKAASKTQALEDMVSAGTELLAELVETGQARAVIGMGGGQGTWLCSAILRKLPIGLPKILITTIAHRVGDHVAGSDIVVFPSVTDLSGRNHLLELTLTQAAVTAHGLSTAARPQPSRPLVAMTMFGVTTTGGQIAQNVLMDAGYDVAVFHSNGPGGRLMERLIRDGRFIGVLDWSITELVDELIGGIATAGPDRLTAAGETGLPQLVVPGAIDMANFGAPESIPSSLNGRLFHRHTPNATLMRTSVDENRLLGQLVAEKLNRATGPVAVLIPENGFSALDAADNFFFAPDANAAFLESLQLHLNSSVRLEILAYHINDPLFAKAAGKLFLQMISDQLPPTPKEKEA